MAARRVVETEPRAVPPVPSAQARQLVTNCHESKRLSAGGGCVGKPSSGLDRSGTCMMHLILQQQRSSCACRGEDRFQTVAPPGEQRISVASGR